MVATKEWKEGGREREISIPRRKQKHASAEHKWYFGDITQEIISFYLSNTNPRY